MNRELEGYQPKDKLDTSNPPKGETKCPNCGSKEYHLGIRKIMWICQCCDYSEEVN